jgi:PAS domain S-box-containing protein
MNDFQEGLADTAARTRSEHHIEGVRQQGGLFVEAVRVTRMPMMVTDALLPGNPITFANEAFLELSGYGIDELLGQDPHFMNGADTDPVAVARYQAAIAAGLDETLEIVQYRKDGAPFRAMLFASPLDDGQGQVTSHFLSYLDISRRYDAEESLRKLTADLEDRVEARTAELEAANGRLKDLLCERDLLMIEVNHRAKNSLAVASALLAVQGRRQDSPIVRSMFDQAQVRLSAMAQLHDLLSKSEGLKQQVDVETYIQGLCAALEAMTGDDDRITLKAQGEAGVMVGADIAIPLGIVLSELITNAIKYAFPAPRSGTILVQARRRNASAIELTVSDDGIGITDMRDGSLGFGLVRTLVHQIDGTIEIGGDLGVLVTITIPLAADA